LVTVNDTHTFLTDYGFLRVNGAPSKNSFEANFTGDAGSLKLMKQVKVFIPGSDADLHAAVSLVQNEPLIVLVKDSNCPEDQYYQLGCDCVGAYIVGGSFKSGTNKEGAERMGNHHRVPKQRSTALQGRYHLSVGRYRQPGTLINQLLNIHTTMKKMLFGLLLTAFMIAATVETQAQKYFLRSQYGLLKDTISNTTPKTLATSSNVLNTASIYGGYDVQVTVKNLTGTTGDVKCVLLSSIDGVNFMPHFNVAGSNGMMCDTVTLSSVGTSGAAKTHIWTASVNTPSYSQYYATATTPNIKTTNAGRRLAFRVLVTGAGTHTSEVDAQMITHN
jgi:hypothetical protein